MDARLSIVGSDILCERDGAELRLALSTMLPTLRDWTTQYRRAVTSRDAGSLFGLGTTMFAVLDESGWASAWAGGVGARALEIAVDDISAAAAAALLDAPWELLVHGGDYLAADPVQPFVVLRSIGRSKTATPAPPQHGPGGARASTDFTDRYNRRPFRVDHTNQCTMPFESHPEFQEAPRDARLWRYMDFAKFVSVLETNSLFFASADNLGDPFEGSFPARNKNRDHLVWPGLPKATWAQANEWSARERAELKTTRKFVCVSCWHEGEHESDAMWRLYGAYGAGVAIQTTFGNLCSSLQDQSDDVHIGRVNYIDYDNTFLNEGNFFRSFLHKRLAFEHEHEVRALIWVRNPEANPDARVTGGGLKVPINVHDLIQQIVISPLAPAWFSELVEAVAARYGVKSGVAYSILREEPHF